MVKYTVESAPSGQGSYSKVGAIAEQSFSIIRTVAALVDRRGEWRTPR